VSPFRASLVLIARPSPWSRSSWRPAWSSVSPGCRSRVSGYDELYHRPHHRSRARARRGPPGAHAARSEPAALLPSAPFLAGARPSSSELALRLPSALFGALAMVMAFVYGRRVLSPPGSRSFSSSSRALSARSTMRRRLARTRFSSCSQRSPHCSPSTSAGGSPRERIPRAGDYAQLAVGRCWRAHPTSSRAAGHCALRPAPGAGLVARRGVARALAAWVCVAAITIGWFAYHLRWSSPDARGLVGISAGAARDAGAGRESRARPAIRKAVGRAGRLFGSAPYALNRAPLRLADLRAIAPFELHLVFEVPLARRGRVRPSVLAFAVVLSLPPHTPIDPAALRHP
jgi:hypothetical protein